MDSIGKLTLTMVAQTRSFQRDMLAANRTVRRTTDRFDRYGKAAQRAKKANNDVGYSFERFTQGASVAVGALDLVVRGALAADAALAGLAVASLAAFANIERTMLATKGAATLTDTQLRSLNDRVLAVSANSVKGTDEIARATRKMAMAGQSHTQIMANLGDVTKLAAIDMADTGVMADHVTNMMSALGIKTQDFNRVANIMASTTTKANTNIQDFAIAMAYAGPVLAANNAQVEEAAALYGVLANSGIKASRAGTSMRSAYLALSAPTDRAQATLKEMNVQVVNAQGQMRTLTSIMQELGQKGMTDKDAKNIFGKIATPATLALAREGAYGIDLMRTKGDELTQTLDRLNDTTMKSFSGELAKAKANAEALAVATGENLAPAATAGLVAFSAFTAELTQNRERLQSFADLIINVAEWHLKALHAALLMINSAYGQLRMTIELVVAPLRMVVGLIQTAQGVVGMFTMAIVEMTQALFGLGEGFKYTNKFVDHFKGGIGRIKSALGGSAEIVKENTQRQTELNNTMNAGYSAFDAARAGLAGYRSELNKVSKALDNSANMSMSDKFNVLWPGAKEAEGRKIQHASVKAAQDKRRREQEAEAAAKAAASRAKARRREAKRQQEQSARDHLSAQIDMMNILSGAQDAANAKTQAHEEHMHKLRLANHEYRLRMQDDIKRALEKQKQEEKELLAIQRQARIVDNQKYGKRTQIGAAASGFSSGFGAGAGTYDAEVAKKTQQQEIAYLNQQKALTTDLTEQMQIQADLDQIALSNVQALNAARVEGGIAAINTMSELSTVMYDLAQMEWELNAGAEDYVKLMQGVSNLGPKAFAALGMDANRSERATAALNGTLAATSLGLYAASGFTAQNFLMAAVAFGSKAIGGIAGAAFASSQAEGTYVTPTASSVGTSVVDSKESMKEAFYEALNEAGLTEESMREINNNYYVYDPIAHDKRAINERKLGERARQAKTQDMS